MENGSWIHDRHVLGTYTNLVQVYVFEKADVPEDGIEQESFVTAFEESLTTLGLASTKINTSMCSENKHYFYLQTSFSKTALPQTEEEYSKKTLTTPTTLLCYNFISLKY